MDHIVLSANSRGVHLLKLVQFAFLLEHVFDKSASAVCHFAKTIVQSPLNFISGIVGLLTIGVLVRHVPDVVRDKLLHPCHLDSFDLVFLEARQCF